MIIYHPDVVDRDIEKLLAVCRTPEEAQELLIQIQRAITEIIKGKGVLQTGMRPPYRGWHRKKMHRYKRPPDGQNPDLRIIYQISSDTMELRILAIGLRIPGSPLDIYAATQSRTQEF